MRDFSQDDPTLGLGGHGVADPVDVELEKTLGRGRPDHEAFNIASHAMGAGLGVAALLYLVWQADTPLETTAFTVYGTSLVLLYLSSTTYHAASMIRPHWPLFRRLDHSAIFLFIAGSYTPPCLLLLPPGWGWTIFGIVWSIALAGVVLKVFFPFTPRWANVAMYVGLGWVAIIGLPPMLNAISWDGLAFLAAGGLLYTGGAIMYATGWPNPLPKYVGAHGVWHVMVLAASLMHFLFMAFYVL